MKSATRWGIWAAVLIVIVAAMHFTGLSLMAVRTGSMRPGIQPGDAVIGISPTLVAPAVGDIIVAAPKQGGVNIPPIAHRIISQDQAGWHTKGDFNNYDDSWTVHPSEISHTVLFSLPLHYVRDPRVIAGLLAVGALVVLWPRKRSSNSSEDSDAPEGDSVIDLPAWKPEPSGRSDGPAHARRATPAHSRAAQSGPRPPAVRGGADLLTTTSVGSGHVR